METLQQIANFLKEWKDALAAVQSLVTIGAVIFGGFWAYIKLFKGRTYKKRLEPSISGKILYRDSHKCAIVRISIKNVGLSRVDISRKDSSLRVRLYDETHYLPVFHNANWEELGVIDALLHHAWIEPGETITEERAIALPNRKPIAVELRLRLLPEKSLLHWRGRTEWTALAVIYVEDSSEH